MDSFNMSCQITLIEKIEIHIDDRDKILLFRELFIWGQSSLLIANIWSTLMKIYNLSNESLPGFLPNTLISRCL